MNRGVKIEQYLFGYMDGHRLLASSSKISEETIAQLLLWSDLAPNVRIPINGSYWTGKPIPSSKVYALIKTWLAPEMSRPGCVWSHVLLISFADIARFSDLSILTKYFQRPNGVHEFNRYSFPIEVDTDEASKHNSSYTRPSDENICLSLIRSIYEQPSNGVVYADFGEADNAIFAIWSQQWPRLRRSFSFRTAAGSNDRLSSSKEFNLLISSDSFKRNEIDFHRISDWEEICLYDLLSPGKSSFRRFLWRYGSDIRYGLKRFKLLTNVYLLSRGDSLKGENLSKILLYITKSLISLEEGKVLKEDLIGQSQYSLLPKVDPIDMLDFFVSNPFVKKVPILTTVLFESLHDCWDDRSEQILSIAEKAAKNETDFETEILRKIANIIEPSTFFEGTRFRLDLRYRLIELNPRLLTGLALIRLSENEVVECINLIPEKDLNLTKEIILALILIDSGKVAKETINRFPDLTIATVLDLVDLALKNGQNVVPEVWIKLVSNYSDAIIRGRFIERASSTAMLSFLADILRYNQKLIMEIGPLPWAASLKNAEDNVSGAARIKLLAFLLQLALYKPVKGSEPVFEISFETIHTELLNTRFDWSQSASLLNYLPNIGWFNNWDICLRLRISIVQTYLNNNLNSNNFQKLTSNKDLYKELNEIAKKIKNVDPITKKTTRPSL